MGRRGRTVKLALGLSVLAASLTLLVPALTGRPTVSYASSASMEPTIGVFDAFFVNPWPGDLEVGDVIVFDSVTQGGPAVHRLVAGDHRGWYTRGDANAGVDQDAGEPIVTRDRILGRVVTWPDGRPVLLDDLGITFIETRAEVVRLQRLAGGERELAAAALLLAAALSALPGFFGQRSVRAPTLADRRRRRILGRVFPRGILGRHVGLGLLVLVLASLAWSAAGARVEVGVSLVVVEDPTAADDVRAAAPGNELARNVRVGALGVLPTLAVVEGSERVRTESRSVDVPPFAAATVTVHERAGPSTGLQHDSVAFWRYPAFLPDATLVALHDLAPGAPYAVLGAAVALAGYAWFALLGISSMPMGRTLGLREDWR